MCDSHLSRRNFIASAAAFAAGGLLPLRAPAAQALSLRLTRDGQTMERVFLVNANGRWVLNEAGYADLCWLFRDEGVPTAQGYVRIDPYLLVALRDTQVNLGGRSIIITNGFRTPQTNAKIEGAAKRSQHLYARAADIVVDGVAMEDLYAAAAMSKYAGGMGLYNDHIHVDVGNWRNW